MVLIADVLNGINSAFPLFSHGERHIDEFLETFSYDQDGISQQLLEVALANIVVADDYAEWLLAHCGTVSKDLDLEF